MFFIKFYKQKYKKMTSFYYLFYFLKNKKNYLRIIVSPMILNQVLILKKKLIKT